MKTSYILIIIIFVFYCCTTKTHNYPNIDKCLQKFENKFISHFPYDDRFVLQSYECSYPEISDDLNLGVWLIARYKFIADIDKIFNELESNYIKKCFYSDSCNLILPKRYYSDYKIEDAKITACSNKEELVPIPLFHQEKYDLNLDSLNDYTLYVLSAEPGKFINHNLLLKEGYMPDNWAHGYSKGTAINNNNKDAIFWIEIW